MIKVSEWPGSGIFSIPEDKKEKEEELWENWILKNELHTKSRKWVEESLLDNETLIQTKTLKS